MQIVRFSFFTPDVHATVGLMGWYAVWTFRTLVLRRSYLDYRQRLKYNNYSTHTNPSSDETISNRQAVMNKTKSFSCISETEKGSDNWNWNRTAVFSTFARHFIHRFKNIIFQILLKSHFNENSFVHLKFILFLTFHFVCFIIIANQWIINYIWLVIKCKLCRFVVAMKV